MARHPRIARLLGLLLGTLALAGVSAPAASAVPTQGVFEKCPLSTAYVTCVSRLSVIGAGGAQVVVFSPRAASLDALATYAAAAHSVGISVMWSIGMPDWWKQPLDSIALAKELPAFAAACGCQSNQALFSYFIGWLRALPATYGYYAADDTALNAADGPGIAAYMARLKQLDPVHPAMIGLYNGSQAGVYEPIADMLGQEIYPVTTSPILPVGANESTWSNVAASASAAQAAADSAGKPSAFILQAFSWGDNLTDGIDIGGCSGADTIVSCNARLRYPSAGEQLALRNAVLGNAHPALILWYSFPGSYGSAVPVNDTIYPSGADASSSWTGLSAAIRAPWTPAPPAADTPIAPRLSQPGAAQHPRVRRHRSTRLVCHRVRAGARHRRSKRVCARDRRVRHVRRAGAGAGKRGR
jgi:hypothetical protein